MKNSEQPIAPCMMQKIGTNTFRPSRHNDPKEFNVSMAGLSKREYFAGLAMNATDLESFASKFGHGWAEEVARGSVMMADALLAELEKK